VLVARLWKRWSHKINLKPERMNQKNIIPGLATLMKLQSGQNLKYRIWPNHMQITRPRSSLISLATSHFIHQYHPHLPPITTQSQPCVLPSPSPHISIVLSAKPCPHPSIITIHQDPSPQAPSRCPQHQRHLNRHSHPITTPLRVTRTWRLY